MKLKLVLSSAFLGILIGAVFVFNNVKAQSSEDIINDLQETLIQIDSSNIIGESATGTILYAEKVKTESERLMYAEARVKDLDLLVSKYAQLNDAKTCK